jgi:hypothetical protein
VAMTQLQEGVPVLSCWQEGVVMSTAMAMVLVLAVVTAMVVTRALSAIVPIALDVAVIFYHGIIIKLSLIKCLLSIICFLFTIHSLHYCRDFMMA